MLTEEKNSLEENFEIMDMEIIKMKAISLIKNIVKNLSIKQFL